MSDFSNQGSDRLQTDVFLSSMLRSRAEQYPAAPALRFKGNSYCYRELADLVLRLATAFQDLGYSVGARIAVHLPNCPEAVVSSFAAFEIGGVFVPINPLYRQRQILHVLADCGASILITTRHLFESIADMHADLETLDTVVFVDSISEPGEVETKCRTFRWTDLMTSVSPAADLQSPEIALSDPAVIFYTSGSTGRAKGVAVSHKNLTDGARIVSSYLGNTRNDRVLGALPLSFDYGFSQATTMVFVGGELVLTNYMLPQTLLRELAESEATGLAGVPTMWAQLANLKWPTEIANHLEYLTNSGGRLPKSILNVLRRKIPESRIFLMYGLTEAFRSSYLEPSLLDKYPDSIGRAIPEVNLYVVRPDGTLCEDNEPGELVHAGALVSLGYWNDAEATERRFRQLPAALDADGSSGLAVWSGDIVTRNEDGFLFFVERADSMIKCSGYRISPTEIEETIYESGLVEHVVAIGIRDPAVGQRIGLAVVPKSPIENTEFALRHVCARELPPYMQPDEILYLEKLILTATGKPDRAAMEKMFISHEET